jgi:hypothetical protein
MATKQIKTGYVSEPIPLIGVRTQSGIPAVKGVTATYRGLQVGRRWTPAEYYKASKIDMTPTPEGTVFKATHGTQFRVGKLRYEMESKAIGAMERGYFLPKGKAPIKPTVPELTTAEKGMIPLEPAKFPLSTEVITPKPITPTRFYGEIRRPFVKGGDVRMAGSEARMRWTEIGERRLIYGIKGAPKQPKLEITTEGWRFRPTFPPSFRLHAGVPTPQPRGIGGYAPKQIPPDMYFKSGVPESSRFMDFEHALRPTTPAPTKPLPTVPAARAVAPRGVPSRTVPTYEPHPQRAPATALAMPRQVAYAEPITFKIPSARPRDVGVSPTPQMQRAPATAPPLPRRATYAEPPTPSKTVETILAQTRPPPVTAKAKPRKSTKAAWLPLTPPVHKREDAPTPVISPFDSISPAPSEKEEDRYTMIPHYVTEPDRSPTPYIYPTPIPDRATDPTLSPDPFVYPTPIPDPEPEPAPDTGREFWKPPPPTTTITKTPPPPPPLYQKTKRNKNYRNAESP